MIIMRGLPIMAILFLSVVVSACRGGDPDSSSSIDNNPDADGTSSVNSDADTNQENIISGSVIDDAIENAKVCLDLNYDKQCTGEDVFTRTDENGVFSLSYESNVNIEDYDLIADIRYLESTDVSYFGSAPYYDYVLTAFDKEADNVVISPVSSLLRYRVRYEGLTQDQAVNSVIDSITQAEVSTFSQPSQSSRSSAELLLENFAENSLSVDQFTADFSTRLLTINQTMARKMQESQLRMEDAFYGGNIPVINSAWSESSAMIVGSANANIFVGVEEIFTTVGATNYENFDADSVSDSLVLELPTSDDIAPILDALNGQRYDTLIVAEVEPSSIKVDAEFLLIPIIWSNIQDLSAQDPEIIKFPRIIISYGSVISDDDCLVLPDYLEIPFDSGVGTQVLVSALSNVHPFVENQEINVYQLPKVEDAFSYCNNLLYELEYVLRGQEPSNEVGDSRIQITAPTFDFESGFQGVDPIVVTNENPVRSSLPGDNFERGTLNTRTGTCGSIPCTIPSKQ